MTHTFPSTEFPAAYANASNYEDDVIKTLVVCECSCCICSRWSLDGPCEGQMVHFSTKSGVADLARRYVQGTMVESMLLAQPCQLTLKMVECLPRV